MASDFPRSRAAPRSRTVSLGATRTTASPWASRKRSSAPETCRQSSIAHTRSPPWPRAQVSRASKQRRCAGTVRSASIRPLAASTAATVCDRLCVSAPITIIVFDPSLRLDAEDRIAGGQFSVQKHRATHLSGHAGILGRRRATRHQQVRPRSVDRKSMSQPVTDPRTYRTRRTPPPDAGDSCTEKVKSACWSWPPVGSCGWARVTDVAKCRRQGLVVCRAALPFEGCCDARPGVALAPALIAPAAWRSRMVCA